MQSTGQILLNFWALILLQCVQKCLRDTSHSPVTIIRKVKKLLSSCFSWCLTCQISIQPSTKDIYQEIKEYKPSQKQETTFPASVGLSNLFPDTDGYFTSPPTIQSDQCLQTGFLLRVIHSLSLTYAHRHARTHAHTDMLSPQKNSQFQIISSHIGHWKFHCKHR